MEVITEAYGKQTIMYSSQDSPSLMRNSFLCKEKVDMPICAC